MSFFQTLKPICFDRAVLSYEWSCPLNNHSGLLVFAYSFSIYWFLLILSPKCIFEGLLSSKSCCLSADIIFLDILCEKTNLSPFFRGAEEAEFIVKVTLPGYVSSWQLGKILLSVSHMKDPSFSHLSASQETFWPSQTEQKSSLGYWKTLSCLKWSPTGEESTKHKRHCWGLYFFKEDILSCVSPQERKAALADFSVEFPVLFLLFFFEIDSIFGGKGTVQKRSSWAQILCFRVWLKTCISPNSHVTRCQVQKALITCILSLWKDIFKAERRRVLPSRDKWHIVNSERHSDTVIMSSIEMPINNTRKCPDTTAYLWK